MEMDSTIVNYMECMKRMSDKNRIHLGSLDECRNGLEDHLQEIINAKDFSRAQKANNSLGMYSHVFVEYRKLGADYMLRGVYCYIEILKTMLNVSKKVSEPNEPPTTIILSNANWSMKQRIIGKIGLVSDNPDLDELVSLRNGYPAIMIYLMKTKASVFQVCNWPDKNSVIISAYGGNTSEELNAAMSEGILYINGAIDYFSKLEHFSCKIVCLLPPDDT